MGKFKEDLETGKKGEEKAIAFLKRLKGVTDVLDVSGINTFQKVDVDLICVQENGKHVLVEVKTDTLAHKTGNIAYEVYSNKYRGTKGCFEKTKAKYIFYYLVETEQLYIIITEKLRAYVHENLVNKVSMISMGDNASGYLIKIEKLIKEKIAFKAF